MYDIIVTGFDFSFLLFNVIRVIIAISCSDTAYTMFGNKSRFFPETGFWFTIFAVDAY